MSTTKHTPGPWRIAPDPLKKHLHPFHCFRHVTTDHLFEVDGDQYGFFNDRDAAIICTLCDSEEQEANARLIAAAPDSLAALRAIVACVDRPGGSIRTITAEAVSQARAAISKAEGNEA